MLTPRSGKDTDERTERLQGSSTTAQEAPPSARRPRMIADSASQRVSANRQNWSYNCSSSWTR